MTKPINIKKVISLFEERRRLVTLRNNLQDKINATYHMQENLDNNLPLTNAVCRNILPAIGTAFFGYKSIRCLDRQGNRVCKAIVTLVIPASAERVMGSDQNNLCGSFKCRASAAYVVDIDIMDKRVNPKKVTFHSHYELSFIYTVGKRLRVNNFVIDDRTCAPGIHFFMTRRQAELY